MGTSPTVKKFTSKVIKQATKNSILFSVRAPVGKLNMANIDCAIDRGLCAITGKEKHATTRYLKYEILSNLNSWASLNSSGSVFGNAKKSYMYNYELKLPPLQEQKTIAGVLSSFDNYIENLQKQNTKLEELCKNLFTQTFINNPNKHTWEEIPLGDFISVQKGKTITKSKANGNIPVVAGGLNYAYFHNIPNTKKSITISASGANAGYVWFHYYPIWASDCTVITDENDYKTIFIYLYLKINQAHITRLQTGAVQPHVYPKQIAQLKISCPTNLKELMNNITPLFNKISTNQAIIQKLKNQRDYLLPNLINGKIRVK